MKPEIIVVDDEPHIRDMLTLLLELNGFSVSTAVDGLDAWDKITQSVPHVVILDVMMPEMDGLTLCCKLRAHPQTTHLPVIMLSGKTQFGAEAEGLAAGANFYMWKPMKTAELVANIHTALAQTAVPA
ncbi:MAG TPA: response regulator [Chloroflexota bacterium]|nr:response regulator [Chloroflexota bacterium]